ncbi:DUF6973 domain-containing protein [Nocardia sp. NPDC051321]|uniref:DUF6973 domain-containing protein n=1 Tax=Nocardia sp. NPDC051321 TaxID=3364323 RepID=UPI0037AD9A61
MVAAVGVPLAVDTNKQLVPVTTSVTGNQLSYQFGPTTALPVLSYIDSASNQAKEFWDLGVNERDTCERNPFDCYRTRKVSHIAVDTSVASFPGAAGERDNRVDAARHCIWMGRTTEGANADFATQMGNAHEIDWPGSAEAGKMDQWNNITGRGVGLRNEGNTGKIDEACVQYARVAPVTPDPPNPVDNKKADTLVVLRDP